MLFCCHQLIVAAFVTSGYCSLCKCQSIAVSSPSYHSMCYFHHAAVFLLLVNYWVLIIVLTGRGCSPCSIMLLPEHPSLLCFVLLFLPVSTPHWLFLLQIFLFLLFSHLLSPLAAQKNLLSMPLSLSGSITTIIQLCAVLLFLYPFTAVVAVTTLYCWQQCHQGSCCCLTASWLCSSRWFFHSWLKLLSPLVILFKMMFLPLIFLPPSCVLLSLVSVALVADERQELLPAMLSLHGNTGAAAFLVCWQMMLLPHPALLPALCFCSCLWWLLLVTVNAISNDLVSCISVVIIVLFCSLCHWSSSSYM